MAKTRTAEGSSQPETIYRLLYSSKIPKSRTANEIEDDIEVILRNSRIWNSSAGITGVLVTNKKMYSQIIEGPSAVIKNLIGHISCDPRHQDVRIVSNHKSDKRIFENWSMAFIRTTRDLEAETFLFPSGNGQSNIMAISAFCTSVRNHILHGITY